MSIVQSVILYIVLTAAPSFMSASVFEGDPITGGQVRIGVGGDCLCMVTIARCAPARSDSRVGPG